MIKTRFAPSPTGYLHVGGLRTALYNYLYAKKTGGTFVLRIEDTDQSRKVEGAVDNLLRTFNRIGIQFDEGPDQGGENGPYFQSQRLNIYMKYINELIDSGNAYPCFCDTERLKNIRQQRLADKLNTPYDRHCLSLSRDEALTRMGTESHIIRLKSPADEDIIFYDIVRDQVSIKSNDLDDQVILKTDGFPTYHLANVVDDHLMGITHVIRGEEWLSSTPKHVLLYRFLGWSLPKFAHLPLLLNPDKSKLSKRQGDVAVEDFLDKGFLAETMLNFVALLGWNPGNDKEIFSLKNLEKDFSIKRIQKSGAVFDQDKLNWMNSLYLKNESLEDICKNVKSVFASENFDISNNDKFKSAVDYARKRVNTLKELPDEVRMFYFELKFSNDDQEMLSLKTSYSVLQFWLKELDRQNSWNADDLKSLLKRTTEETGVKGKDLYSPLRLALYGSVHGPDMPTLFNLLDLETIKLRLKTSLEFHTGLS
jgi:nondiscriminating glutamyl-tRNA synthetase